MGRSDDHVSGLEATVAPTEPPSRPSGLEATVAPTEPPSRPSGHEATIGPGAEGALPSGARAAVVEAAGHDAKLTVVDPSHYAMLGEFARGGLGRIVKARDTRTGRLVAIKEMLGASSDIARRFMREALLTANLQHPAIVPVYELGKWPNGEPFYAMKLVDGRSFEEVLAGARTFDARLALLPTLVAVAEALAYAHAEKIIHRDLKPANVLVGKFGETVVIDWGLAKRLQHDDDDDDDDDAFAPTVTPLPTQAAEHQTIAGAVMGTPAYMPPEQARGDELDPRADVYALGAILYHLLSGAAPYAVLRPKHAGELLRLVENGPPPRLEPDTAPADLIAIVDKAMARDPANRYPSAKGLAEDLRRFTTGQLVGAHHYDRWTLLKRWLRRHRAAVTVAGILLVVLSAVAVVSVQRIVAERARAEAESARARAGLALALAEKGDAAERDKQWGRAALYYQASLLHADDPRVRFDAGRAEARTIALAARHVGHRGWVQALALAGDEAVTVDEEGEVRRWALADGRLLASWKAPTPLHAVAVSPDGTRVAVGGDDGVVRILDRALVPIVDHRGHTQRVFSLAFSGDGHALASGSADASIRIVARDGSVRTLAGHQQRVYSVAFSPDGKRLASASDDRTARIWNLDAETSVILEGHPRGGVKVAAWFPDGERLFTTGWDRQMKVWDARTGKLAVDDPGWQDSTSVHAGVVAAAGKLIVTGGDHAIVKVWDPATRSLVAQLDGHVGQVSAVAVSASSRWLVSAGRDGTPRVWDLGAAFRLARLGHQKGIRRVAFAPDGKTVISSALDNTIRRWDAATGAELRRVSPFGECNDGASLIGGEVAAGCGDGNLYVWSAGGTRTFTGTGRRIRHAVEAPDGSWIAAGHVGGWMHVWDPVTGALRASRAIHDHQIYGVRALPGGRLLTAALDNTVRMHDGALELLGSWRAPGIDGLLDAAIDPRGRFVVAGGDGFPVFRWDLTKPGAPVTPLAGHTGTVWSVDVSRDGALVASASSDGTIRIWDTTTWTSQELRGPKGGVLSLAFGPDGTLVSGHQRGAVIVWDVARRIPLRRLGASEAGELGSCADFEAVAWNDPVEKSIVLGACLEPSGFARLSARTHLVLENEIDLVERWSEPRD